MKELPEGAGFIICIFLFILTLILAGTRLILEVPIPLIWIFSPYWLTFVTAFIFYIFYTALEKLSRHKK